MFPPSDIAAAKSNSLQILPSIDTQKGKKNKKKLFSSVMQNSAQKTTLQLYVCISKWLENRTLDSWLRDINQC